MARPNKIGLDYFSLDSDFFENIKVRKIMRACGANSIAILICLLCNIYRNKGYYILWDEDLPFLIADSIGVTEGAVSEVLTKSLQVDFFNSTMYKKHKIITSKEIQNRYLKVCSDSRRINYEIRKEYELTAEETQFPPEEMQLTAEEMQQSKVNNSKYLESSNEDSSSGGQSPPDTSVTIDYKKLVDWFNEQTNGIFGKIKYPLSDKRKRHIRARVREHGKKSLFDVITKATESDFLKGQSKSRFTATFDWLILPTNFEKVLSGNYDNRNGKEKTEYVIPQ